MVPSGPLGDLVAMRLGVIAALLGALAVVLGAFGAHALRDRLGEADRVTFETAARYHLLHALAAVLAAERAARAPAATAAGWAFVVGTLLFSGSLYGLALGGPRLLGVITPLGGMGFILGWLLLAWSFVRRPEAR
jgi:uncharacterized membrane protein YgdD (TMEM256/DUF423 family)